MFTTHSTLIRHLKILVCLSLVISFSVGVHSQATVFFKKIDKKNSFKDIRFGSSFDSLVSMMGLVKDTSISFSGAYTITESKYLTLGIYNCDKGIAMFTKLKISSLVFTISRPRNEVLNYFTSLFGKPTFKNGYWWRGANIGYFLGGDAKTGDSYVAITSLKIVEDDGSTNF